METATLLAELTGRDVRLWVEDDRLKCSAPVGALDAEMRTLLAARKDDVLAYLKRAQSLAQAPANIVPIQPEGSRAPLFVLSGHGGDVYYLLSLARNLDADRPVLSVQPPGLNGGEPLTTVEELARYEVAQIRQFQPSGPYLIAGHCAGGTIAFEAAQQLIAQGEQVAMLVLIGSPYPTSFSVMRQRMFRISGHLKALMSGSLGDRQKYILSKLQNRLQPADMRAGATAAIPEARQRVENATLAAVRDYTPKKYPGHIDLIITSDKWHQSHRWAALAGSAHQHMIEDHAINELLLGPNVTLLAATLQRRLSAIPA